MPISYLVLLRYFRPKREETEDFDSMWLLHQDYKEDLYWWEAFFLLQKFIFIGTFSLEAFNDGTVRQTIAAFMLSMGCNYIMVMVSPYYRWHDDAFAVFTSLCQIALFMWCVLVKINTAATDFLPDGQG